MSTQTPKPAPKKAAAVTKRPARKPKAKPVPKPDPVPAPADEASARNIRNLEIAVEFFNTRMEELQRGGQMLTGMERDQRMSACVVGLRHAIDALKSLKE